MTEPVEPTSSLLEQALQRVRRCCDVALDDAEQRAFDNALQALSNASNALWDAQRVLQQAKRDFAKVERERRRAEVKMQDTFLPSDEVRGKLPGTK